MVHGCLRPRTVRSAKAVSYFGHTEGAQVDTESHYHLRKAAVETLGPVEFDRLVVSFSETRRLGRLRYWQEQLLARIPGGTVGFEEFIAAFENAPLQRPKAEASAGTAPVRFVEAWRTNTEWRDHFVENATRELSKHGELGCHAHVLRELACGLHRDEVVWLFAQLQRSLRATLEWRDEFLALFPQVSLTDLPQPLYDEEEAMRLAEAQHAADERARAEAEAEYIRQHGALPGPDDPIPF